MAATSVSLPPTPMSRLLAPVIRFIHNPAAAGILLLVCAVGAMIWANTAPASYFGLWQTPAGFEVGPFKVEKTIGLLINDALMVIFFFLVGLEIKREILFGELAAPKKAMLTIFGALGGMVAPALIYVAINAGQPTVAGWGVPMATDIAFAVGILSILGTRVPVALKVFLTALAIVDDMGAVIVIALFYTENVATSYLLWAAGILGALFVLNRMGVTKTAVYALLGIALWYCFLKSGVHATIAGVLLALTIPARPRLDGAAFLKQAKGFLHAADHDAAHRAEAITGLETVAKAGDSPLNRFIHALHGWVMFFIMPVFALANAGVTLPADVGGLLTNPVTLGIVLGLFFGKQIGVFGFAWLAVKLGLASLPGNVRWIQVYGVSIVTGIGFTMALFIGNLAFRGFDAATLDAAKLGILLASSLAAIAGLVVLRVFSPLADAVNAPARDKAAV